MFTYETGRPQAPRLIINFPTKGHWRARSRLADIKTGLAGLREVIRDRDIRSIAVPPLGCGLGGLDWQDVRPLIIEALDDLPDVQVILYSPESAPDLVSSVATFAPRNSAWATYQGSWLVRPGHWASPEAWREFLATVRRA